MSSVKVRRVPPSTVIREFDPWWSVHCEECPGSHWLSFVTWEGAMEAANLHAAKGEHETPEQRAQLAAFIERMRL